MYPNRPQPQTIHPRSHKKSASPKQTPSITAAVYHATGVRVRDLPVTIEDLLTAKLPA